MQRIMVDLPDPDGPQMTMRSPRLTCRLMSRSTWKSPYHLCMPTMSTAISLAVVCIFGPVGRTFAASADCKVSLIIASTRSAPVAAGEARLGIAGIARHHVAEREIEHGREHVAGRAGHRGRPFGIDARRLDGPQQVEHADDRHQRGVLEQPDIRVDDRSEARR